VPVLVRGKGRVLLTINGIFYFILHSFFYNNAFGTAVKFEDLMALKKELIVRREFSDSN
jgi:hypothetical protein